MQLSYRLRFIYVLGLALGLCSGALAFGEEAAVVNVKDNFAWDRSSLTEHREQVKALVDDLLGPETAPPKAEAPADKNLDHAKSKP